MKRKLSLLLSAIAFIAVPLGAYLRGEAETSAQLLVRGYACRPGSVVPQSARTLSSPVPETLR